MMKVLGCAAVISATTFSSASFAQGLYLYANGGQSNFDVGSAPGFNVDDSDTNYDLGFGYQFNKYFAAELGYTDLGKTKISTVSPYTTTVYGSTVTLDGKVEVDAKGLTYGVRGNLPITDSFNAFARLGFINWKSDLSASGTVTVDGTSYTGSGSTKLDDGNDPYGGLGVEYKMHKNVALAAQWNRYKLDYSGENLDVDSYSLGVRVIF